MIYLLLLLLLITLVLGISLLKFEITSAFSVTTEIYLISTLFVIYSKDMFYVDFLPQTVLIIVSSIWALGIGEYSALCRFNGKLPAVEVAIAEKINLGRSLNWIVLIFGIVAIVLSYQKVQQVALLVGYKEGEHLLIQYGRLAMLTYDLPIGYPLAICGILLRSFSYIYSFVFVYNLVFAKTEKWYGNLPYLAPSVLYLVQSSLFGSRGALIEFVAYVMILIPLMMMKTGKGVSLKFIKYSTCSLCCFFVVFILLGNLKGGADYDPFYLISIYTGGGLVAFDKYIEGGRLASSYFGEESLLGINNLLFRLGVYDGKFSRIFEFITIGPDVNTNVYTALRRYVQDYGLVGMLMVQVFIGLFFGFLYSVIKRMQKVSYIWIYFALNFSAIVYQSIDEQFLLSILSTTQVFTLLFTFLLFHFFVKKQIIPKGQGIG